MTTTLETKGRSVRDVMHRGVYTCPPETPLRAAAATMARHRIHCLVVFGDADDGVSPWSVLTDRDLAAAVAGGTVNRLSVADAATDDVLTISPDDSLEHAAQLMVENESTHLVVGGERIDHPLGIVSSLDLAASIT